MILRLARGATTAVLLSGMIVLAAHAGGLFFGPEVYSLDLQGAFGQVPSAAQDAFAVFEQALTDQGATQEEIDEIESGFQDALAQLEATISTAPTQVPVPLLAGGFDVGLPLVVIDGIRFSFGLLTDGMLREVASWAGIGVPAPLVDASIDLGEETATVTGDVGFVTWSAALDAVKRLDLWIAAFDLFAGCGLTQGRIDPSISVEVPAAWTDAAEGALDALRLDGLTWSAFSLHGGVGLELGLPFLRLYVDVKFVLPLGQSSGWWNLRVGQWAGALGMVIRF
jgi:hypothetical protein